MNPAEELAVAGLTIGAAINRFQTYLEVERNLARTTRDAYRFDLMKFKEFLESLMGTEPSSERITTDHLRDWLAYLQSERGLKTPTMQRNISSLRVFFRWAVETGQLTDNPALPLRNPKMPRKLPVYLVQSELSSLLDAEDSKARAPWLTVRDRTILVTLAFTGLRRQELVDLDVSGVDFDGSTLRVFGKGRKERLVPMGIPVKEALQEWFSIRPVGAPSEAVFLNNRQQRLTGRHILNIVRGAVQRAGIEKKRISPHKLRHTFATMLHLNDVDILEIKSLLGHASIISTQIYTHTNTGRLRTAVDRLVDKMSGEKIRP